jgi:hypothetical protein
MHGGETPRGAIAPKTAQAGFHANIITRKNGIGKRFAPAKEFIDAYIFHNPWQTMKKQAKE